MNTIFLKKLINSFHREIFYQEFQGNFNDWSLKLTHSRQPGQKNTVPNNNIIKGMRSQTQLIIINKNSIAIRYFSVRLRWNPTGQIIIIIKIQSILSFFSSKKSRLEFHAKTGMNSINKIKLRYLIAIFKIPSRCFYIRHDKLRFWSIMIKRLFQQSNFFFLEFLSSTESYE